MKKIGVINGLRGAAMLGVIYQHLFWTQTKPGFFSVDLFGYPLFPLSFLSNGWISVNLFFILSGFVLYLPYAGGRRSMSSWADLSTFYKRRGARLLPLYYISVLATILFMNHSSQSIESILRDLFLMGTVTFNFTIDMWMPKYNFILWSIGIEIWFSLLFPLLLLITRRVGVLKLFIFTIILGLVVRYLGLLLPGFDLPSPYQNALKDSLPGRLDDFVLGMLLCWLYLKRESFGSVKNPVIYLTAGLLFLWIGCSMWDYTYLGLISKMYVPIITNVLHVGFFLIVAGALGAKGWLASLIANRPLQVIGMMSYSIYIWHHMAIYLITGYSYTAANLTAYFAFVLLFSALTYRYIEFGGKDARALFLIKRR